MWNWTTGIVCFGKRIFVKASAAKAIWAGCSQCPTCDRVSQQAAAYDRSMGQKTVVWGGFRAWLAASWGRCLGFWSSWHVRKCLFTVAPGSSPYLPSPFPLTGWSKGSPDENPGCRIRTALQVSFCLHIRCPRQTFPLGHLGEGRKSSWLEEVPISSALGPLPSPTPPPVPLGQLGHRTWARFQGELSLPALALSSSRFIVAFQSHCVLWQGLAGAQQLLSPQGYNSDKHFSNECDK